MAFKPTTTSSEPQEKRPSMEDIDFSQFQFVNPFEGVDVSSADLIEDAMAAAEMGDELTFGDQVTRVYRFAAYDRGVRFLVHEKWNQQKQGYDIHIACPSIIGRECPYCAMSDAQRKVARIKTEPIFGHQVLIADSAGGVRSVLSKFKINSASPLPKIAELNRQLKAANQRAALKDKNYVPRHIDEYWLAVTQTGEGRDREFAANFAVDQSAYPQQLPEIALWSPEELLQMAIWRYSPELFQDDLSFPQRSVPDNDPDFGFADDLTLPTK